MRTERKMWKGKWIEPKQKEITEEPMFSLKEMFSGKKLAQSPVEKRLHPSQLLKRTFTLKKDKKVSSAVLSMTAHGIYLAKINGKKVSEALFTPDYTSYEHYLQYQVYEITNLLKSENVWSVTVADGWYGGRVSVNGGSAQFGNKLGILGEIEITYTDGTIDVFGTDQNFVSSTGKYIYSDIFIGEKQDLRLLDDTWETDPLIEDYKHVEIADYPLENLVLQKAGYVRVMETLNPVKIWQEENSYIIDFGQVIAGRVQLNLKLRKNQEIILEHSEVLNENGLFFNNIVGRNKEQKDIFIGRGKVEVLEPDFTFHGFRFVRLSGWHDELKKESIKAKVLYTEMRKTGSFITDNAKLNQLISNIEWSQKGNMLSIPTDCPQRERVGWTGDMQVFAPTATFFLDVQSFIRRWLDNVRADQLSNGEIIDYSPAPKDYFTSPSLTGANSSAGWGDAIIMVPWTLYQRYGKIEVLEENYEAMVKWHEFSRLSAAGDKEGNKKYLWDTKFHFGDWMFPSYMIGEDFKGPIATSEETREIFGTAFLANSSSQLGDIAVILGLKEEAKKYHEYARLVKNAFEEAYFKNGKLIRDFQGCYVIAVAFDMLSISAKEKAVKRLVELISENNNCLDTGFLSVPYLLDVLVDNGQEELARQVFLQEKCPSWLYEVDHGATTIWESWAGIQPDGMVGDLSFNHYAFGCVGDWMIREIAGLQVKEPGYREFYVTPNLNLGVKQFELKFESASGTIKISLKDNELLVDVPENSLAFIRLPNSDFSKQKVVKTGKHSFSIN